MATRSTVTAIGPSIIAAVLMVTLAALSIGTASAQYPIGQGQVLVYSPPPGAAAGLVSARDGASSAPADLARHQRAEA